MTGLQLKKNWLTKLATLDTNKLYLSWETDSIIKLDPKDLDSRVELELGLNLDENSHIIKDSPVYEINIIIPSVGAIYQTRLSDAASEDKFFNKVAKKYNQIIEEMEE